MQSILAWTWLLLLLAWLSTFFQRARTFTAKRGFRYRRVRYVSGLGALALFFVMGFLGTTPQSETGSRQPSPPEKSTVEEREDPNLVGSAPMKTSVGPLSAQELWLAYVNDEVAAKQRYTGQDITVTGVVDNGGRNPNGSGSTFSMYDGTEHHYNLVRCYSDQNALVAQLSRGDTISVRGQVRGWVLHTTVLMDGCEILEHTTPQPTAETRNAISTRPDVRITAHDLLDGYYTNGRSGPKFAADEPYQGKTVEVSGTIDGANSETIAITDGVHPDEEKDVAVLYCDLIQFSGAEHLTRGNTVTVRGRFDQYAGPHLKGCVIVAR